MKASKPAATASTVDGRLAGAIGVLLGGLTVWQWVRFGVPFGGDWAQYMSHARAIVEGAGYGNIGYLFSPYAWIQGPPVYPPGLPVMLAPLVAISGDSLVLPRLLMHALLAVFLVSVYRYFARTGDSNLALGTVAMLAAAFLLAGTPNIVGSDLGMCAFVWVVLALVDRDAAWTWRRAVAIGVCGVLALNLRVAAAPLVPAILLWGVLHRRDVRWSPWVLGLVWALALGVVLVAFGPGEQASGSRTAAAVGAAEVSQFDRWLRRALLRITTYRFAISEAYLYPFPVSVLNNVYHVVALPITAVGFWVWVRRDWKRLGGIFVLGTVAMLAMIPVWVGRYAWVVTPFICYGLLLGISTIWTRMVGNGHSGSRLACTFAAAVSLMAAVSDVGIPPSLQDDKSDWQAAGQALIAEAEDPSELRLASNRPRVLTWYTRIPAAGLPDTDVDLFLQEAQRLGVTHLVFSTQLRSERVAGRLRQWREAKPEAFERVGVFGTLEVHALRFTAVP